MSRDHFFKRPAKGDVERTLWTMAFTPILMFHLAYATDKNGVKIANVKFILRVITYLMVLRVANPFSTGSGVPVASP